MDKHLYKKIKSCYINKKDIYRNEIFVHYVDGTRERIWTYNPTVHEFDYEEFIGMSKIEAVFYCDRSRHHSRNKHSPL